MPLSSKAVLELKTLEFFLTQVLDIFFNCFALLIPFLIKNFVSCLPTPQTSLISTFSNIGSISLTPIKLTTPDFVFFAI